MEPLILTLQRVYSTGGDYDTGYVLAANLGGSNSNPSHFVAQTIKTHKGSFKRVGNCVRT